MCETHPHIAAESLNLFNSPSRILLVGSSNSGKSHLCDYLIRQYHEQFKRIIICGVKSHPVEECPTIKSKLITSVELLDPSDYQTNSHEPILLIIDDLYVEALNSPRVCELFTRGRHQNVSTVLVAQNIFPRGKYARDVSLNASHYILTRVRDLYSVETLGRQLFGGQKAKVFLDIYNKCMSSRPFSHLLVDLSPNIPASIQLRSNLNKQDGDYEIVYQI